jgi:hypothetical protein
MTETKDKTTSNFIDEITELLKKSKHFHKVIIEGDITNIVIEKPKEDKKDEN